MWLNPEQKQNWQYSQSTLILKDLVKNNMFQMNLKGISFYLGLFLFPIVFLSFINILYASYFDYFLSIEAYLITLSVSLISATGLYVYGRKAIKKIDFIKLYNEKFN